MYSKPPKNIILIIAVALLIGASAYLVSSEKLTLPASISQQGLNPAPPASSLVMPAQEQDDDQTSTNSTAAPTSATPAPVATSCDGLGNTATVELDGQSIGSLKLVTGGSAIETINGGNSFNLQMTANTSATEKVVFLSAAKLAVGQQQPQQAAFRIEYREYDKSTTPYTNRLNFIPQTLTGLITTRVVATKSGERVCGTFNVTGSGDHTIQVSGSFNQILHSPKPGAQ